LQRDRTLRYVETARNHAASAACVGPRSNA
jgi:hypothetical protein